MRDRRPRGMNIGVMGVLALLLAAASAPGPVAAQPKSGGTLKAALTTSPPTLDFAWSTAAVVRQIAIHIFEDLVTFDEKYQVIPQLAESWRLSEDGRTYTFQLRRGVKFHTGREMKAADVKASIERFLEISARAKDLKAIKEVVAVGDSIVDVKLSQPSGAFLPSLAMPFAAVVIMPVEAIRDAAGKFIPGGKLDVKQLIGTGPYQLVEWIPDRHVRVKRFADYARDRSRPASGLGGDRAAYLDEILFIPVPEKGARIAGLEAGEYDYADSIPFPSYSRLKDTPGIVTQIFRPDWWIVLNFNPTKPPFNDVRMRQAVLAALNRDEVMATGGGLKEFYRLDPGLSFQEQVWHTSEAAELYNQKNPEKAKRLMAEAGYKGQEIVIITNSDYDWMLKAATVTQAQLKAIGMNVTMQVYDWPGQLNVRKDRSKWDISYTGVSSLRFDPTGLDFMLHGAGDYTGYKNPKLDAALDQGARESDPKKRYEAYRQGQRIVYEDVPLIKHGDLHGIQAHRAHVKGYSAWYAPRFWNVWLEK